MSALEITHTSESGTLIDGTGRGDGSAEVLKANGWRWGRSIGMWFVPRTRDVPPKRGVIDATAEQLRAAGFEVEVSVDATPRDQQAAEGDRAERAEDRAARFSERAQRRQEASDAAYAASKERASHIPFGQPLLVGHHSQRRAERDGERIRAGFDRSVSEQRAADYAASRAKASASATAFRENPYTVANRIDRLAAEVRKIERIPEDRLGTHQRDLLSHDRAQLEHWEAVRAQQITDGLRVYGREDVNVGDLVHISGSSWWQVARVNPKTVTLRSRGCSTKAPYHQIRGVRPADESEG